MTLYDVLLLFHILAAITWVGGAVALNLLGTNPARGRDGPRRVRPSDRVDGNPGLRSVHTGGSRPGDRHGRRERGVDHRPTVDHPGPGRHRGLDDHGGGLLRA